MFDRPLTVRRLALKNRLFLAPLAGVSDEPFRRVCTQFGAGLTFVEMLASNAVLKANRRTIATMRRHPDETVLGVQVAGPTPEEIAAAIRHLDALDFDAIDINMGCPVRKIVARGWGSAMLLDPAGVARTVALARAATDKPLSVKLRLGYSRETLNIETIVACALAAGVDMVTIHGRVRDDRYNIAVDRDAMRAGFRLCRAGGGAVVTVANGDALDAASAHALARDTGCDAVMIARGALGNPWVFRDCLAGRPRPLPPDEWLDTVLRHMDWHADCYGRSAHAAARFRKHLLWYVQGFPGSRVLRETLNQVNDFAEVGRLLRAFAAGLPAGVTRDAGRALALNRDQAEPARTVASV